MALIFGKPQDVRQILPQIDPEQFKKDLEVLRNKALKAGAADATIISVFDVVFNQEVSASINADNKFPSLHWPLNYPAESVEEAVRLYQRGVFLRMATDPKMPDYGGGPIADPAHRQMYFRVYEIVTLLESTAFYMGYHLTIGLAVGNCRSIFCADEKRCWGMIKGKACLHPYKGLPSMEAVGIDAMAMARKLKWKLPRDKAAPLLAGLVMVE